MLCVCVSVCLCAQVPRVHVHLKARRQLQAPSSCAIYFCFLWDRFSLTCELPSRQSWGASVPWDLSSFLPYGIMPSLFACVRWGWSSGDLTWVLILTKQALYQLIYSSSLALLFMITDPLRELLETEKRSLFRQVFAVWSFLLNVTPIYSPLIVWSILEAFSSTPGKTWINDVLLTCMTVEQNIPLFYELFL